ncbi:uncharacterized protein NDAI_0F03510 [Naumovozyma dairenensis CBS 421]|uniref:Uncharacterized protein n=1 Tax=Naumovozyma dairenensis (strain ATCC 10597 / BCRC 20456 / CBS 421 / NBRC 0211 / NRRL Y-12639) TaxID=1071378 RepID=G0WD08_NAUDC|nr:hypothetical protein NDAI_0F03510 [Naumovozyma dairenensis CBS 421]CCD25669.1 hypothetical protein NDAI_0F03510 [Naumovozyma dairenensis CBS 421]
MEKGGYKPDDEGIHDKPHGHNHVGILPEDCPGPDLLHLKKGEIGIPGCGKASTEQDKLPRHLKDFNADEMVEAQMNENTIPAGCQDTSMKSFSPQIEQSIPGAGCPMAKPHHIEPWSNPSQATTATKGNSNTCDMIESNLLSRSRSDNGNDNDVKDYGFGSGDQSQGYEYQTPRSEQRKEPSHDLSKQTHGLNIVDNSYEPISK